MRATTKSVSRDGGAALNEEEAAAHATAVAHSVLFSPDQWPQQLLPWMDRASKRALRTTSVAMRRQVDTCIVMMPLTTTTLAGLESLALGQASIRVLPMFSSSVSATLQVIDLSWCESLRSIAAVRGCAQLGCLRIFHCFSRSDLSPLAGCNQLEKLWMAAAVKVTSLAPLKACPGIRKLDLRGCSRGLHDQVEDLKLSCTQLTHPLLVELEGQAPELQPYLSPGVLWAVPAFHHLAGGNPEV
ncbi:hypothetical protein FOA52_013623 [Chlamydomonas sp. UWO 241]|nr:hypothetical protein FOA52_013623 [Chlamydomonas sp. UWO 241]